jgi:2-keto-4-pentenoate hydratase/2-oxohepta-3-ene-1,7-dioic acid hydratase in catechol pathway
MRIVTYDAGAGSRAGALVGNELAPIGASVRELLASGAELGRGPERIAVAGARIMAPIPDPEKVICLGLNYRDHAAEAGLEIPQHPLWFAKFANSIIGDGEDLVLPASHPDYVDYEAELAVVISRTAKDVRAEGALACVGGVMAFNDVSARDLQLQNPLWTSGKAIDTFAPCGPLVTMDEIADVQDLSLRTRINGEVVQEGSTRDMIFGVAECIAWLSRTITLRAGDIIATGTPAGIGAAQGRFLRDGDVVAVELGEHSRVTNRVRAG